MEQKNEQSVYEVMTKYAGEVNLRRWGGIESFYDPQFYRGICR